MIESQAEALLHCKIKHPSSRQPTVITHTIRMLDQVTQTLPQHNILCHKSKNKQRFPSL
jgi:hypothetical protein